MDNETREEFSKINQSIVDLTTVVNNDIFYRKGLNLSNRMTTAETNIEILDKGKSSWKGLCAAITLVIVIISAVTGVIIASTK